MKRNKGFTLIELLVVIAIIGILASVILAALNSARSKGADAAAKSQLANMRAQGEIVFDKNGCYGSACSPTVPAAIAAGACNSGATPATGVANSIFNKTVDAQFNSMLVAAISAGGSYASCSATVGGTSWAAGVLIKSVDASSHAQVWCVDSSGDSKLEQLATTTAATTQATVDATVPGGQCL